MNFSMGKVHWMQTFKLTLDAGAHVQRIMHNLHMVRMSSARAYTRDQKRFS